MKAVDALLTGLVDYAGLFPPASESMRTALENYAAYRAGDDAQALGRFIVPIGRLKELEDAGSDLMPRVPGSEPWRLSVLVSGDIPAPSEVMEAFNSRHASGSKRGHAVIDVAELKARTVHDIGTQRSALPDSFTAYFEIPADGDVSKLVAAIAAVGARAKLRAGGVTPESIPSAGQVIEFITACRREGVPFKATAGLHHPVGGSYRLTYEPNSPTAKMYGFLNVFLASTLHYAGGSGETVIAVLEESDRRAFTFEDDAIVWRDKRITTEQIEASRHEFATSFGSCSFREPIDELAHLARNHPTHKP